MSGTRSRSGGAADCPVTPDHALASPSRRRIVVAGAAALVAGRSATAARAGARVGYLEYVSGPDGERLFREFVEGLQDGGYVAGRNLTLLRRSADMHPERLRAFANECAVARVDAILATTTEGAKAAKVAAPGIPTVFVVSDDPVFEGLVKAVSRPGGVLTGVVTRSEDLTAKRLELLKEAFPRIRSVAVVGSSVSMARAGYRDAAGRLGIAVREFPIEAKGDYRDAAAALARSDADGVLVVEDADEIAGVYAFVRLMMATRRPAMFNADLFVEDENWGLMAYGVSLKQQYRRAAEILARVLGGVRPADIPVEQPTRYELVVNLRAAQEYGHQVPAAFLVRADRVVR